LNTATILIVEDELIIAENLRQILLDLGYSVGKTAASATEAKKLIRENNPDLVILDITILGAVDGIDLAAMIKEEFHIPFIFLTSHSDPETLGRAKETYPYGYLVKPFQEHDIKVAVEIALNNFKHEQEVTLSTPSEPGAQVLNDSFFVKNGNQLHKLKFTSITHLESDGNYTKIYVQQKKCIIRASLKDLEPKLTGYGFVRVHKSYLVNLDAIETIGNQVVNIGEFTIPVSRAQYKWLLNRINTL
jgi:DNA-binding LytR/AlgR family response regulator